MRVMQSSLVRWSFIAITAAPMLTAMEMGTVNIDTRLRFEAAEQAGKEDGDNTSLRARVGYTLPEMGAFSAMIEGEFTGVADKDGYNAAGVHGDPAKAVIADPENAQLDQLWFSYKQDLYSAKVGRQVIALDNQRWVGHVGWRQNRQTYDAVTLVSTPADNLTVVYGYVDKAIRIFGSKAPDAGGNAEETDSDSHLINAGWDLAELGKISVYGYLLDLEDLPATVGNSDTYGISYKGTCKMIEAAPITLYGEYANQDGSVSASDDYNADYLHASLSTTMKSLTALLGYESLGSDQMGVDADGAPTFAAVQTPLATGHKFSGFADLFLVTPETGLVDSYVQLAYAGVCPWTGPFNIAAWYHDFESDEGSSDLGDEVDVVVVKPFELESVPGKFTGLFKYADYESAAGDETLRYSVEVNYGVSF